MKRLGLAVILMAFGAGSAMAADMAVKAPPPVPVAATGWTGFYAGINAGYGQSRDTALITEPTPFDVFVLNGQNQTALSSYNMSGALAGLQGGYDYQFSRNWVIGIETDIQATSIKGSGTSTLTSLFSNAFFNQPPFNTQTSTELHWFGTVRARAGFLPANNLLLYATGGLAYGEFGRSGQVVNPVATSFSVGRPAFQWNCDALVTCYQGIDTSIRVGWTLGAGAEFRISPNVSVKAEYLRMEFESQQVTLRATQAPFQAILNTAFGKTSFDIARVGLNYRFGDAAVVAKY